MKNFIVKAYMILICITGLLMVECHSNSSQKHTVIHHNQFLSRIFNDTADFFHVNLTASADVSADLPIGMFDSGTGGLTVLRAVIDFDCFNNSDGKPLKGGDGKKDFSNEKFVYFGDQANMPYGNYPEVNKTGFLKELILKDALFLLGDKYFRTSDDKFFRRDKQPVKIIIIFLI